MAAVEVSGLDVARGGSPVLRGIDCSIASGSVTGLLGPSGGGKTTLMRAVMGVQIVHGGTVTVLGRPAGHPALRRRVGYSTQQPAVYRDLTVEENLRYFSSVLGASRSGIDRVIDELDLTDCKRRLVSALSGGQLSRTSLAVALLGEPELLVLDEPTVGADPVLRDQLWDMFHRLAAGGTTLLISSHVMDEAARCERLLLLREGRLLAEDTPEGLRRRTGQAELEAAFLALVRQHEGVRR